jgi:glycosyltransferase involved in cell wall biosynthesis
VVPLTPRGTGRVIYASFATPRHSGGVHVQTQHVQLLRDAGYPAWLWLPDPAVRPGWFGADLPVLAGATLDLDAEDLLVLPEAPLIPGRDPAPGGRKVIFNQNHFYTYAAADPAVDEPYPGWSPAPAVWTVSTESRDILTALLPDLDVVLIPNPIEADLFRRRPASRPKIAWFPRKRPREASLLRRLLRSDPRLAGVELCELVNTPRPEVAESLGTTTVFVSLGHSESFGLTVAEAFASECLVVGYDGGGGHELFDAPGSWRVPEQRPLLLVDAIADLIARADELAHLRAANRSWVLERYGIDQTAAALQAAVDAAFARPGEPTTATHPAGWLDVLGPNFTAYA